MPKIWRDLVDYFGSITALRDGQQPANNNLPVAYINLSADGRVLSNPRSATTFNHSENACWVAGRLADVDQAKPQTRLTSQ